MPKSKDSELKQRLRSIRQKIAKAQSENKKEVIREHQRVDERAPRRNKYHEKELRELQHDLEIEQQLAASTSSTSQGVSDTLDADRLKNLTYTAEAVHQWNEKQNDALDRQNAYESGSRLALRQHLKLQESLPADTQKRNFLKQQLQQQQQSQKGNNDNFDALDFVNIKNTDEEIERMIQLTAVKKRPGGPRSPKQKTADQSNS
ncbi:hypothetical protein MIR68_008119 [Amoeboaphelidium protococcarum]|nr:hypothetical protein MIR68_008119 [Amoeboaphelidium protococcarum]